MKRYWLTAILFGLFILEGTVVQLIVPPLWQSEVRVSPQLVLVVILFIAVFLGRHMALAYGFGFGLLHDIVYYGHMMGTFAFSMALAGYFTGFLAQRSRGSIVSGMFLILAGNLLFLWTHYGIYRVFQITHADVKQTFLYQMVPSLLVDLLFALAVYVPVRKLLEPLAGPHAKEDE